MNFNQHVFERMRAIQGALMSHHAGGATLPSAVKGNERETFVRDYLSALFPPPFRFGSGAITDREGNISGQLDVVIEYPFSPSFPMPGGSERLYLAESVALAIEIKSDLSAQWGEVLRSTASLQNIWRYWEGTTQQIYSGIGISGPTRTRVPYIAVGYKGYKTLDALERRMAQSNGVAPQGALVIESGSFVGPGVVASGPNGLYYLAVVITNYLRAVSSAEVDLTYYL